MYPFAIVDHFDEYWMAGELVYCNAMLMVEWLCASHSS
jgi:hypothetical protein